MDEQGIRELEERLKKAMLASDVDALDALLADDLSFVDATGKVWTKADDLNGHRYGMQRIEKLDVEEQSVRVYVRQLRRHGDARGAIGDVCGRPVRGQLALHANLGRD